jgi:hypothetical protein
MKANRRSYRAMLNPREIGLVMLASRRTIGCRRKGQRVEFWVGCLFERPVASQAPPKTSRQHDCEGTGAIQRP